MIDNSRKTDAIQVVKRCKDEAEKFQTYLIKKYTRQIYKDSYKIIKHEIKRFYFSYYPHMYNRYHDLYNVFKITVDPDKGTFEIEFNYEFMKFDHREENSPYSFDAVNEYIYNNSFLEGYHGGHRQGENHPNPGVPYYRKYPSFTSWLRPAEKTISPYKMIEVKINKKIKDIQVEMQNEYDNRMHQYLNRISSAISKIKK